MDRNSALGLLFLAALLEAGGDAVVRKALYARAGPLRIVLFIAGGLVLFAYGYTVNAPQWDFGKLLGLYVVVFFVVAQLISWLAFRQAPSFPVLIGGGFIITGGLIVALAGSST